ncbi:MAG: dihydroorotate dehydrogenase [Lachnospiraceae bacterium]|nr:dihydroorotate dehydrogenase [Lachnospiraceae bacterium]
MNRLETEFCGIRFQNPVTVASGTFGSGQEFAEYFDISKLGAVTTKGVADQPWSGNPTPRIAETASGMLNAIGLQNPGIETFLERDLPFLQDAGARVIVNVCGHSEEEYLNVVRRLNGEAVDLLEINISCPNVQRGGLSFGTDPREVESITKKIKDEATQPILMKLSPNVTDITEIAKAAEAGGADGLSLINTLLGMKIDTRTRRFALANRTGGLSGPAIHPIAVRMVYETAKAVKLPILGMGGISDAESAIEMILAGATMVAVGTANFSDPTAAVEIIAGIEHYLEENQLDHIRDLVGAVEAL